MKVKPQCQLKECLDVADFHPVAVFHTREGIIRAVVGLKICPKHKKVIKKLGDVLADGGARIVTALGGPSMVIGTHLEWCALNSKEALDYEKMHAAAEPS
jgi:hypothetical protein